MGRLPTPEPLLAMRTYAASCYATSESPAAAAALLKERYGTGAPARPARFCKKWGERMAAAHTVHDAARPGRPTKVSAQAAATASSALKAGSGGGGAVEGYRSLAAALHANPTLKRVVCTAQCSPRTLLRRMRQVDPSLVKRRLSFRPPLSLVNRQKRLAIAKQHLQRWHNQPTYFRRVMWLDAAKIKLLGRAATSVWCDANQSSSERVVTHPALSSRGQASKCIRLEYYAAVNTETGAIALIWCSTSTGSDKQFKVSAARAHHLPCTHPPVRRCRPQPTKAVCRSLGCTLQRLCGAAAGTAAVPGSPPPPAEPCHGSGCAALAAPPE